MANFARFSIPNLGRCSEFSWSQAGFGSNIWGSGVTCVEGETHRYGVVPENRRRIICIHGVFSIWGKTRWCILIPDPGKFCLSFSKAWVVTTLLINLFDKRSPPNSGNKHAFTHRTHESSRRMSLWLSSWPNESIHNIHYIYTLNTDLKTLFYLFFFPVAVPNNQILGAWTREVAWRMVWLLIISMWWRLGAAAFSHASP